MCVCVHVCACECVHVCMCACVHVCMCIYMYVCVHVCVCMCARVCACVCMCKVVTSKFHNHYNVLTINLEDLQVGPRFEIIWVLKTPPSGVHLALIGAGIHWGIQIHSIIGLDY